MNPKRLISALVLLSACVYGSAQSNVRRQLMDAYEKLDLGITYVTDGIGLPSAIDGTTKVTWSSSDTQTIDNDGSVTLPEAGTGNRAVTLKATLHNGNETMEKYFSVTVLEEEYGMIMSYTQEGESDRSRSFCMAASTDNVNFTPLNHNKAVVYPLKGSRKLYLPSLFRKPDGTFGMLAADDDGIHILVYSSPDLIDFRDERLLLLNTKEGRIGQMRCVYDNLAKGYFIRWADDRGHTYQSFTRDFVSIEYTQSVNFEFERPLGGNLPAGAAWPSVLPVTKAEYDKVVRKYGQITNIGIVPPTLVQASQGMAPHLPEFVTANYSDGSTRRFGVEWDKKMLGELSEGKPGRYVVTGTLQQPQYASPLIRERADPHVVEGSDGYYYFTASYPMYRENDPNGYDRVILRRARSIEALATAEEICIWHEKNSDESYRWVWAPEIREIEGTWYVFFTTATSPDVWSIRPRVIACNKGDRDPFKPENWEQDGHLMEPVEGDNYSFKHFSLDMTHFEDGGRHYVVWAEKPNTSDVLIAEVDGKAPWKLKSKCTILTKPEYAWEHDGNTWVNEGPAVIKNRGKVYLAYSASAVNHTYCVGLLSANSGNNLLDIAAWKKMRYPMLSTEDLPADQNGPGHNSFTTDGYGNPVMVYHARNPKETIDGGLFDPGRHTFVKAVHFAADGVPVMNMTREQELDPAYRIVKLEVVVK